MLTTDMKLRVFWSDAEADRLFWQLYNSYLAARPRVSRHPFLFITPDGDPMTPAAFTKVHAAAARRIGLVPAKHLGTTPHGHRHEYASAAAGRNVTPKILQVALAHRALSSQEPYKNPYLDEIAEAMCTGAERRLSILRQDTQI
jgi:integrase